MHTLKLPSCTRSTPDFFQLSNILLNYISSQDQENMAQPTLQVSMAISPASFSLGDEHCTLSITATLSYPHPITIYTWPTIFNLYLAQRRHNFFCIDLSDNNKDIRMSVENVQRTPAFSLQIGDEDDEHLGTFHPGVPVTITGNFDMATRNFREKLQPGHRYRFGIRPDSLSSCLWNWLHGTREDVMSTEHKTGRESERSQVIIEGYNDVDIEVVGELPSFQRRHNDVHRTKDG